MLVLINNTIDSFNTRRVGHLYVLCWKDFQRTCM